MRAKTLLKIVMPAIFAFSALHPVPSWAETGEQIDAISAQDLAILTSYFAEAKIAPETQKQLLRKLDAGIPWDSFHGGQPVNSVTIAAPYSTDIAFPSLAPIASGTGWVQVTLGKGTVATVEYN